jgi:hypothetical protein
MIIKLRALFTANHRYYTATFFAFSRVTKGTDVYNGKKKCEFVVF